MITLQLGLEILGLITGGIFLVAKLDATNKANKEAIDALAELIKKNMQDTKELLQLNKEQQRESLAREISHLKDLINLNNNEMRADIQRLDASQRASNMVKERTALLESSVRSLHKRLDLEPPAGMRRNEED